MATPNRHTKHWIALKSRIDTLVTSPALTKAEPGQVIDPGNAPFLMISDARNPVIRNGVDPSLHTYSGTLILSVRWPVKTPIAHAQLVEIGGDIADHFPADTMMFFGGECLRVIRDAEMMQPDVDGAWRNVDVRVLWSTV